MVMMKSHFGCSLHVFPSLLLLLVLFIASSKSITAVHGANAVDSLALAKVVRMQLHLWGSNLEVKEDLYWFVP